MNWLLLIDSQCGLCSFSARWIARLDRRGCITFACLHGRTAAALGLVHFAAERQGSIVLWCGTTQQAFTHSDAVIQVASLLGFPWSWLKLARVFPKRWRDWIYQSIADRRHRLFPARKHCSLNDQVIRSRWLD